MWAVPEAGSAAIVVAVLINGEIARRSGESFSETSGALAFAGGNLDRLRAAVGFWASSLRHFLLFVLGLLDD
ncbi:hypothetical protein EV644_115181 [Kribbella orskensis]|uniref:Uncharacterized protein n=1 Tax=Kribbella orskensis TaxID=2512216 RepID=A0ABY2BDK1_9ACTN|nr:hypothetical protein EV642_116181 [Kribbella sp. VKM Ac-2500]TCO17159.1 hypothetical protein EV644_115181 [Kribbella orskensis]